MVSPPIRTSTLLESTAAPCARAWPLADRAEQRVFLVCLAGDVDLEPVDPGGLRLGREHLLLGLHLALALHLLVHVAGLGAGRDRELARQQVVAREARFHVHGGALVADALHVFEQNHFHRQAPRGSPAWEAHPCAGSRATRRSTPRRPWSA